jgi:hypothetical protein
MVTAAVRDGLAMAFRPLAGVGGSRSLASAKRPTLAGKVSCGHQVPLIFWNTFAPQRLSTN